MYVKCLYLFFNFEWSGSGSGSGSLQVKQAAATVRTWTNCELFLQTSWLFIQSEVTHRSKKADKTDPKLKFPDPT